MASQVAVQPASMAELFLAQVAAKVVLGLAVSLMVLMLPLVGLHVLHRLAAESADLRLGHVDLLHVLGQVHLQLVAAAAVLAYVLGLLAAVHAQLVPLQAAFALVLHVAYLALEEVVGSMDHLVLF